MSLNNAVLDLLTDLVKFESVTPDKSECQKYIADYLSNLGFKTEYIRSVSYTHLTLPTNA